MDISEEERIKKAFQKKDWPEIKVSDSWATFKIMAEFVEGFEKMSKIGPCVSIFGSARTKADTKYYDLAVEVAKKLVNAGFGVIDVFYHLRQTRLTGCKADIQRFRYCCY